MRSHYDFSKAKKNPYASRLKRPVTVGPGTWLTLWTGHRGDTLTG